MHIGCDVANPINFSPACHLQAASRAGGAAAEGGDRHHVARHHRSQGGPCRLDGRRAANLSNGRLRSAANGLLRCNTVVTALLKRHAAYVTPRVIPFRVCKSTGKACPAQHIVDCKCLPLLVRLQKMATASTCPGRATRCCCSRPSTRCRRRRRQTTTDSRAASWSGRRGSCALPRGLRGSSLEGARPPGHWTSGYPRTARWWR